MVPTKLLRSCSHLSDLPNGALDKLASIGEQHSAAEDDVLFTDMDPAESLMLVVQGAVRLCCELGTGEMRTMDTASAGELFAWSALVEPYRYTSTAIAAGPTQYITFNAATLRNMMSDDPELGQQVLTKIVFLLTSRLETARGRLLDV